MVPSPSSRPSTTQPTTTHAAPDLPRTIPSFHDHPHVRPLRPPDRSARARRQVPMPDCGDVNIVPGSSLARSMPRLPPTAPPPSASARLRAEQNVQGPPRASRQPRDRRPHLAAVAGAIAAAIFLLRSPNSTYASSPPLPPPPPSPRLGFMKLRCLSHASSSPTSASSRSAASSAAPPARSPTSHPQHPDRTRPSTTESSASADRYLQRRQADVEITIANLPRRSTSAVSSTPTATS